MATLKIRPLSYQKISRRSGSASSYAQYVTEKSSEYSSNSVLKDQVIENFRSTQEVHGKFQKENFAFEVIQSFNPQESLPENVKSFHQIGKEFVQENYPGFEYTVITHIDKRHFHNHIFINPVHPESGKRLHRGDFWWLTLKDKSNEIVKRHGFSVLEKGRQRKTVRLNTSAKQMLRRGKIPIQLDLIKKLDVARSLSTNMQEYQSLLALFGIDARVENKNISYLHPERQKRVRGKTLGTLYCQDELEKSFLYVRGQYLRNIFHYQDAVNRLRSEKNLKSLKFEVPPYIDLLEGGHKTILADLAKDQAHKNRYEGKTQEETQKREEYFDFSLHTVAFFVQKALLKSLYESQKKERRGSQFDSYWDKRTPFHLRESLSYDEYHFSGLKIGCRSGILAIFDKESKKELKEFLEEYPELTEVGLPGDIRRPHHFYHAQPQLKSLTVLDKRNKSKEDEHLKYLASELERFGISSEFKLKEVKKEIKREEKSISRDRGISFDIGF